MTKFPLGMLFYYQMNSNILHHNHLHMLILDLVNSTFHSHKLSKYLSIELLLYYTYLQHKEYIASQPTIQLKWKIFLHYMNP